MILADRQVEYLKASREAQNLADGVWGEYGIKKSLI